MRILPPVLELLSPPQVVASQSPIIVRYRIRQTRSTAPSALRVRVDGFAQPEARARELRLTASAELREVAVAVPPRDSQVQLFAQGASGMSNPVGVQVLWRGDSTPDTDRVGTDASTLYVLAVGISDYQHADFRKLTSAADGAQGIVAALQRQQGRPYTRVETRLLTGSQATRDNIADALDWLQQRVTARDLGVLFLAGHALGDSNAGWAFLPVNADPTRLRRTTVSLAELRSALGAAPGRILAILDTSNPGSAFATPLSTPAPDIGRVIDELSSVENGVVVLSADGGEAPVADGGADSGAFAKALIEALDGGAGATGAGTLTLKELGSYMQRRVKQMTEGRRHPLMRAPEGVDDFAIVRTAR